MFFCYIIYSYKDEKLYVGYTNNINRRIKEHIDGRIGSTKNRRPLTLIHTESFPTRREAMKRERFLKSLYGSKFKQKIMKAFLSGGNQEL